MRFQTLFSIALVSALLFVTYGCSNDDTPTTQQDPLADFNSSICSNAQGITGLYWDYSNALPVPLTQIPTIQNPGMQFIHSAYPQLGFQLPQGYTAVEVSVNNPPAVGVNVLRNDNNVVWRYVPLLSLQGQVPINDVVAFEVNSMFNFFEFNGDFNVICTETKSTNTGTFQLTFSARLIEFGTFTGLVWVNTLYEPTTNFTQVSASVSVAPTTQFEAEVMNTFLPISFQLLVIDDGVRDSDLDGVPDKDDRAPFNPDIQ